MTKKLIAIAIASTGLAAAGAYANEGHMQKQSSSDQSSTSPSAQSSQQSAQSSQHETTQQSAQAQDSETVKKVQTALTQQGYNPGPEDGQLGNKTKEAIKQAQKDKSLEPTGQIDQQTLAALGVNESGSSGSSSSGSSYSK